MRLARKAAARSIPAAIDAASGSGGAGRASRVRISSGIRRVGSAATTRAPLEVVAHHQAQRAFGHREPVARPARPGAADQELEGAVGRHVELVGPDRRADRLRGAALPSALDRERDVDSSRQVAAHPVGAVGADLALVVDRIGAVAAELHRRRDGAVEGRVVRVGLEAREQRALEAVQHGAVAVGEVALAAEAPLRGQVARVDLLEQREQPR